MAVKNSNQKAPAKRAAARKKNVTAQADAVEKKQSADAGAKGKSDGKKKRSSGSSPKKKASQARVGAASEPTAEQIALRAFSIWESQGRPDGQHEANWLQAEQELRAENGL